MALNVGQLYVNIGANINGLTSGMQRATQRIEDFSKKMTSIGTKLTATVSLPLAMVGKNAIQMAMSAVESEGFFTQSMKDMTDSARRWSEELNNMYGLNAVELRRNVSLFNMVFESMEVGSEASYVMSKNLVQLSHDMATVFDEIPQEDILDKLLSGMTGQSQSLKSLGIIINDEVLKNTALKHGIIQIGEEISSSIKPIATYIAILEASKTSQANLARELNNPASQLRILKQQITEVTTEFGEIFLPMTAKVIGFTQNLVDKWKNLSDAKKKVVAQFGILAVAIPPVITGIGILSLAITSILNPMGLILTGITGMVGAFIWAETKNLNSTENIADAWEHAFTKIKGTFEWFKNLIKIGMDEVLLNMLTPLSLMEIAYNKISFWNKEKRWDFVDEYSRIAENQNKSVADLVEANDKINNPRKYVMFNKVANAGARFNTIPTAEERKNGNFGEEKTMGNGGLLKKIEEQTKLEKEAQENYNSSIANMIEQAKKLSGTNFGDKVDTEAQKVASAIDSITSAIVSLQESMKSQIGIFERFKYKATSTWKLLRNAEMRDKAYKEREQILNSLSQRGLSQDILAQLMQTDISELGNLKGLDRMTDEQLTKWAGYISNADRTAERMANVTIGKVEISIAGQEKNAKTLAKEVYRELKLMGVDI